MKTTDHSFLSSLTFTVKTENSKQVVRVWHDRTDDVFYAFLPSYADLADVYISGWNTGDTLTINGRVYSNGEMLSEIAVNERYTLSLLKADGTVRECGGFIVMQSSNIPAMYIDTDSGNTETVNRIQDAEESGTMKIISCEGTTDFNGRLKYIKGRGNSSWYEEKKSYNISTAIPVRLLGYNASQNFCLLSNARDNSLLENKITFDMASMARLAVSSAAEYYDLYINGEYAGNYLLCESAKCTYKSIINESAADADGACLLEREEYDGGNAFFTASGERFLINLPQELTQRECSLLKKAIQSVENAILDPDGIDPDTGRNYSDMLDLPSFVNKYLIEEISKNEDGGVKSAYYYYLPTGISEKLYAGPVWDYDWAYNTSENVGSWAGLLKCTSSEHPCAWYVALYEKPEFFDAIKNNYETYFLPYINFLTRVKINDYYRLLEGSARMNAVRWSLPQFEDAVANLKSWLENRAVYLSNIWLNDLRSVVVNDGMETTVYYVNADDSLVDLNAPTRDGDVFLGWYNKQADEPFDQNSPITEEITVYAKWRSGGIQNILHRADEFLEDYYKVIPVLMLMVAVVIFAVLDFRRNRRRKNKRGASS